MSEHLAPEEMDAILEERLAPARRRAISLHLLRGCPQCRAVALGEPGLLGSPGFGKLTPEEDAAYEEVLDLSFAFARRADRARRRDELQARKAAALLAQGGGTMALVNEGDMPLAGRGVYEALLERSWSMRNDNPREMIELAQAAVEVARRLKPTEYGTRGVADLEARAWGELGNAYRAGDKLHEAQRAFGNAFALLDAGTGDACLKARLHDFHASLLGTLRDYDRAFVALDCVVDLHMETGDPHLAGRTLVKKAIYTHYSGRSEEALKVIEEAVALLDMAREPRLAPLVLHNKLCFLVGCGRHREAKRLLFDSRPGLEAPGRVMALRMRWVEGAISYGLGELVSAEAAWQEVKAGFEEVEMGFAAALAALELAMVWLRQERRAEAAAMTMEAAGMFKALNIHREVLGSVLILQEAFRKGKETVPLVERTVSFIRRWELDPTTRYEPFFD